MPKAIISDTSCLITLQKIEELLLLKKVFGKVFVTTIIATEFSQALPSFNEIQNPQEQHFLQVLEKNIDQGEGQFSK